MPKLQPLISVIIPCYNYGNYLSYAINSVLEQTGGGFNTEIIIVDDGSTDNTAEIAQSFGPTVRYIHQDNQGLSAARNTGIKNAKGDFIIFLDADDLLGPNVISAHLKNFNIKPALDLSICHCSCIKADTGSSLFWPLRAAHLDLHLCHSNIAPVHAFMTRRETIEEAGFFDCQRKACEDYEYWLRCAKMGKHFAPASEAFVVYRQHGNSMSSQHDHQLRHDISVRLDINNCFDAASTFPQAGTYYGRLAFAAGILGSAAELLEKDSNFALDLATRAAESLLEGAKSLPKTTPADPHLIQAERYYALNYYIYSCYMENNSNPALKRASSFIQARYPNVINGTADKLPAKLRSISRALMCDFSIVQPIIQAYKLPG